MAGALAALAVWAKPWAIAAVPVLLGLKRRRREAWLVAAGRPASADAVRAGRPAGAAGRARDRSPTDPISPLSLLSERRRARGRGCARSSSALATAVGALVARRSIWCAPAAAFITRTAPRRRCLAVLLRDAAGAHAAGRPGTTATAVGDAAGSPHADRAVPDRGDAHDRPARGPRGARAADAGRRRTSPGATKTLVRWTRVFDRRSPDGIRTRATALRGRRARPLHNGAGWSSTRVRAPARTTWKRYPRAGTVSPLGYQDSNLD